MKRIEITGGINELNDLLEKSDGKMHLLFFSSQECEPCKLQKEVFKAMKNANFDIYYINMSFEQNIMSFGSNDAIEPEAVPLTLVIRLKNKSEKNVKDGLSFQTVARMLGFRDIEFCTNFLGRFGMKFELENE